MSGIKRTPGEVLDDAEPILPDAKKSGQAANKSSGESFSTEPRTSGLIEDKAESISDESQSEDIEYTYTESYKASNPWTYLLYSLLLLLVCWVGFDYALLIQKAYQSNATSGIFLLAIGLLALTTLFWVIIYELKSWKNFDRLIYRNDAIKDSIKEGNLSSLKENLAETLENMKLVNPRIISQFESASSDCDTPSDYLNKFEDMVLSHLDMQADAIIKRSSISAGASVVIIPHPALDALAVTWHGVTLSRRIASIYGIKQTGLSSLRLTKYILTNAVLAVGAEVTGELLKDNLSDIAIDGTTDAIINSVATKFAEGSISVFRLYRLGNRVKSLARPFSYNAVDII